MSSFHGSRFTQDFTDADGRLVHAEWDGALWQLFDADTGEFISLWMERQLPAPFTFRPPSDDQADIAANDQVRAAIEDVFNVSAPRNAKKLDSPG